MVVIALGLGGAGTGIAAEAGVFGPTTPPKITFGSARGLMNPADNYNAPGEVTRFVGRGPDGTTFTVVSASSHPNSGCIKLVLTAPPTTQDRSIPGGCEARGNVSVPAPTTSRPSTSDYGMNNFPWKSPHGEMYTIWYGQGPPGTVSIHLVRTVAPGPVRGQVAVPAGGHQKSPPLGQIFNSRCAPAALLSVGLL